jgi:hypothetical protein
MIWLRKEMGSNTEVWELATAGVEQVGIIGQDR